MNHEFITLDFPGSPKQTCRHCACLLESPQASEACPGPKVPAPLPVAAKPTAQDPVEFLLSLDSAAICAKIDQLEGELAGWRILLKVAMAKERKAKKKEGGA